MLRKLVQYVAINMGKKNTSHQISSQNMLFRTLIAFAFLHATFVLTYLVCKELIHYYGGWTFCLYWAIATITTTTVVTTLAAKAERLMHIESGRQQRRIKRYNQSASNVLTVR